MCWDSGGKQGEFVGIGKSKGPDSHILQEQLQKPAAFCLRKPAKAERAEVEIAGLLPYLERR